ncbi:MAG: 1-(5-phosphoribosyl)-5-amino-4-imidazole-carboxylate carboxylase [Candidatus Aminicenantes bacterium RBG_13_62_12]|nr:MAG: 1-(5-phosphoribosyl)-5-amino-4-imidazole-carboxylate carboxylase [Candidatus Aminicenantes bacterium RBG_13_62_12]
MKSQLEEILRQVGRGELGPEQAMDRLRDFPYQDLDFAKVDHHRELRKGFPEVIYGQGKTDAQILRIAGQIVRRGGNLLVTRIGPATAKKLRARFKRLEHNPAARAAFLKQRAPDPGKGLIAILTAGTSDIPVAEEAHVTCALMGNETDRIYDVGVAGLHRLLGEYNRLRRARVIIVAAGMEGALPSVVGGLVNVPIIAVPTSVGYGASFHGLSALLAMLNACPGGVAVVNIDNGFGAGILASLINHL